MNAELHAIGKGIHVSSPATGDWNSGASFSARLQLFQDATSYVVRYRGAWDKLMGILLLLVAPKSYQDFSSSRSRKGMFRKILGEMGAP